MGYFLISIIGVVVVVAFLFWIAKREAEKHGTNTTDEFVGICTFAVDQTVKKQANLNRILEMFKERSELTNQKIRQALKVSSKTAVNYLDELEKLGKVKQVGKTGRAVIYKLKSANG